MVPVTEKIKEEERLEHLTRCPKCGIVLESTSDVDLSGHMMHCPKCGYLIDLTGAEGSILPPEVYESLRLV